MPSHLRLQTTFSPVSAHTTEASFPHKTAQPPQKKQKMTVTQTYRLAHSARGKLSSEASRGDHDLRLLVGHANLLDSLMLELQDAENEQEAWFNETMKNASPKSPEEPKHIQWRDEIVNQQADDEQDSDSEDEEDSDDEIEFQIPPRRIRSPPPTVFSTVEFYGDEEEEDDEESDDEYDNLDLALVRTQSHSVEPLPELVHDSSDDSDDESSSSSSPPTTPPQVTLNLKSKKQEATEQLMLEQDGYFVPPRQEQAPLIAAY